MKDDGSKEDDDGTALPTIEAGAGEESAGFAVFGSVLVTGDSDVAVDVGRSFGCATESELIVYKFRYPKMTKQ